MNELIESIINKEYTKADNLFNEALNAIVVRKLNEAKKMYTAKMFSEQLNVDAEGKFREATGNEKLASIEKAERGLAEGDVVPFGKNLEKSKSNVHVGEKYVVVHTEDGGLNIHHNEGGRPGKMVGPLGSEGKQTYNKYHKVYHKEIGPYASGDGEFTKEKAVDAAAAATMSEHKPDMNKDVKSSVTKLKEEAKKAALKAIQEKVRVRGKDEPPKPPLSARAKRFSAALSGNEKPQPKLVVKND